MISCTISVSASVLFFRNDHSHFFHASTVSSIILAVVYGIQIKESNDPYTEIASEATNSLGEVGPGAFLVDVLPVRTSLSKSCDELDVNCILYAVVKYVPQWFPGAGFQKKAAYWKSVVIRVVDEPWEFVKRGYVRLVNFVSFTEVPTDPCYSQMGPLCRASRLNF